MSADLFEGRHAYGYIINFDYYRPDLPSDRRREFGAFLQPHVAMHLARGTWYVRTKIPLAEMRASLESLLREGECIFIIPIPEGGLTTFSLQGPTPKDITDPDHLAYIEKFARTTPEQRIEGRLDEFSQTKLKT